MVHDRQPQQLTGDYFPMIYDNLSNEELLKEVYLNQHTNRLLTLVCERLEMVMRERDEALEYEEEIDRLNEQLSDQDEEIAALNKRIDDLETTLDSLTDDPEF
jgi:DNA repair exonuclease SbcCD ATPase subunit